jgi:NADH:ubiquinone oxidoreductase subunit K
MPKSRRRESVNFLWLIAIVQLITLAIMLRTGELWLGVWGTIKRNEQPQQFRFMAITLAATIAIAIGSAISETLHG